MLKRFYKADNHATTCYDLGAQDSVSPSTYIKPIVSLARRVERATGIPQIYNNDGKQVWWRILFWGTYREDDEEHPTFIRKNSDKKYTEPHHLIPMSCSDQFDVSLDIEENIVSLCSNCHNEIHYGKNADVLIKKLYLEHKADLERVGIYISLEKLLEAYGF